MQRIENNLEALSGRSSSIIRPTPDEKSRTNTRASAPARRALADSISPPSLVTANGKPKINDHAATRPPMGSPTNGPFTLLVTSISGVYYTLGKLPEARMLNRQPCRIVEKEMRAFDLTGKAKAYYDKHGEGAPGQRLFNYRLYSSYQKMLRNIELPPNTSAQFKKYLAEFDEIAEDFKKLNTTSYVKTLEMDEFEREFNKLANDTNRTLIAFNKHCGHPVKTSQL